MTVHNYPKVHVNPVPIFHIIEMNPLFLGKKAVDYWTKNICLAVLGCQPTNFLAVSE